LDRFDTEVRPIVLVAGLVGILAGLVHVLAGPDHLAAVALLANDGRSWRAGALWGLGHSTGVFAVGLLALLVRGWLPIAPLSSWSERMAGVVLIGIGVWGLHRAFATRVHTHAHAHGPHVHSHPHTHSHAVSLDATHTAGRHTHTHAAFAVGVLHGLAGSSHVLGVIPALALPGLSASLGYLGGFGVGTVAAMTGFAMVIGMISVRAQRRGPVVMRWLLSAWSILALIVGIAWLAR
jgi:ABC-type nickel/cobalt efflux system permease component RcnA